MSETARRLFENRQPAGPQITGELSRMRTQGAMELASALFNGHAFVPYGPGQYTPSPQIEQGQQQEQSRGIER